MKDQKKEFMLMVHIEAKLDWLTPAKNTEEQSLRDHANVLIGLLGHKLTSGVREMILELAEASAKDEL